MKRIIAVILICITALCGCNNNVQKEDEGINIVTSFYPVMLLTKAVAGGIDGVNVTNMTKPQTGCLHDYALLPEDVKTLEKSDIFVINGLGMENFIDDVSENCNIIDLSEGITPLENNAHIWLSPLNACVMVRNLASALSEYDPSHSEIYEKNGEDFCKKLSALDEELKNGLSGVKNRDIVTFHEAFSYFADEFGLNVKAVIEREPGEEPTTKELIKTIDIIKEQNVKALFAEPQYSPSSAEIIARETGLNVFSLDPLVTGENDDLPDVYFTKMRENLNVLKEALK